MATLVPFAKVSVGSPQTSWMAANMARTRMRSHGMMCRTTARQQTPLHLLHRQARRPAIVTGLSGVSRCLCTAAPRPGAPTASESPSSSLLPKQSPSIPPQQSVHAMSLTLTAESVWETVPHWCELCAEPVNNWSSHVGKRDHLCLEMILNSVVSSKGLWESSQVWGSIELFRGHYTKRPHGQPRTPSPTVQRLLKEGLYVPGPNHPLGIFYDAFDRGDPYARREELHLLLLYLKERGMLCLTPDLFPAAVFQGHLLLHTELMPVLTRIFPDGEVRGISALLQMITCTYGLAAAYEICGMERLVPVSLLQQRGVSPELMSALSSVEEEDDLAAGDDATGGEEAFGEGTKSGTSNAALSTSQAMAMRSLSAAMPRAILGSLRWALTPEDASPPPIIFQDHKHNAHLTTLAARTARLLMSELIFERIAEYVYRLEWVLRTDTGQEWLYNRNDAHRAVGMPGGRAASQHWLRCQRITPSLSNEGNVAYTNGGLATHGLNGTAAFEHAVRIHDEARKARMHGRRGLLKPPATSPLARSVRFR
ncbi:hypothetical protein GH5_03723 [Leishmania sp. Ghana 2012 LV757]|uniref:hypothetical protein n=1 Tax=Leishmania sp. Ghana 2012 LV757 TaxID=2803181 RepID=UPI001B782943|nr:hypothetical protein GH5_03723 [Leishmania sp. Ghana 2012 LV757]